MALRRNDQSRSLKRPFLIVCEGYLESIYFNRLKRHPRFRKNIHISIECAKGGKHFTVLAKAKQLMKPGRFDCIWCVFDAECDADHQAVRQTIQDCLRLGFHVGISNPCFDVWILAHLDAWPKGKLDPDGSRRQLKKIRGCEPKLHNPEWFDKAIFNGEEFPNLDVATKTARCFSIDKPQDIDQVLANNPSTTVPLLIAALLNPAA